MSTLAKANLIRNARHASIYGLWTEWADMVEFKISPMGQFARIKIMALKNPVILSRLSGYLGLKFVPRRADWKGFDFVTRLERIEEGYYASGNVHMPFATRKTLANLIVVPNFMMKLEFHAVEEMGEVRKFYSLGSIILKRKPIGEEV